MNKKKFSLACLTILLNSTVAFSEEITKGYFWYVDPPKEDLKEESTLPPAPLAPTQLSQEEMFKMHPDQLAKHLEDSHKWAIYTLEESDYKDYLLVLDVARKKARAATSVQAAVLLNNPSLNPNTDYPVTNAGRITKKQETDAVINKRLITESSKYALGFFVSQTCGYCKDQVPTLQLFQDRTGWNIETIDVDQQPAVAERFGATVTPMLILIKRNSKDWMPVAVGLESLPKIEQNTYKSIRLLEGEITPKEFHTLENQDGGFFDVGKRL